MIKMDIFCVLLICVGTSAASTNPGMNRGSLTVDDLTANPLIQQLIDRVDVLERQCVKQTSEIQSLKNEMLQHRRHMKKLLSKLGTKDKLIQILLRKSDKTVADERLATDGIVKRVEKTKTRRPEADRQHIDHIRGAENRILPVENVRVAFYAFLNSFRADNSSRSQNIVFDYGVTNVGNAYNASNGVFVAPVSGVYVFSITINFHEKNTTAVSMSINRRTVDVMYLNDEYTSKTSVYELNQDDNVSIHGSSNFAYDLRSFGSTSFSGFLLYQTYPNIVSSQLIG